MPLSRITSASIDNSAISAADIADGTITAAKIISVANTQITGNIVSSQIASVNGSVITANTIANSAIQTGAVENYMSAAGLGFGMRNRIINGGMVIDQRNAGASVTISAAGTASGFVVDRFNFQNNITSGTMTVQKSNTAPSGFSNSVLITNGAAVTAASGDGARFWQPIEGFNFADMNFGSVSAQIVTLSFWVRSSLTGTYAGGLVNSAVNRSYVFTYTVSSANTWEQKTVTIAGDTSGTWVGATNGIGAYLFLDLGSGSALNGTAGTWNASYANRTSGSINWVGTNGATFYITGVQLEKGSTATSFDSRDYGRELILCQRYFLNYTVATTCTSWSVNATQNLAIGFPVQMRSLPTYTGIISGAWSGHTPGENYVSKDGYTWYHANYFYGAGSLVVGFSAEL